jgi:hypothetical protein
MRRPSVIALLSLLSITAAGTASAQLCAGMAPFSAGPVRLAAISQFGDDSKMFGAGVALGATNGAFGGLYAGRTSLNDTDETATNYGGHIGFGVSVDQGKKVELCPTATVDRVSASFASGLGDIDLTGTRYGLGFGIGGTASSSPTFDFVPFASVAYNHAITEASFGGTTDKTNDDLGLLTLGAGFVLNKVVTIQPNIMIPFGIADTDNVYGISIALNLGKKK